MVHFNSFQKIYLCFFALLISVSSHALHESKINDFESIPVFKEKINHLFLNNRQVLVDLVDERFAMGRTGLTVDNLFIDQNCGPTSRALKLLLWRELGVKSYIVRVGSIYTGYHHAFLRVLVRTAENEIQWFKLDPTHKQYLKNVYSTYDLLQEHPVPTLLIEPFFPEPDYNFSLEQRGNDLPNLFGDSE
jgi:hypothetical protein